MATFAEYSQPSMPSSNDHDFTLYPFPAWPADPSYLPTTYADQAYLNATAFGPHSGDRVSTPLQQNAFGGFQSLDQATQKFTMRSPEYSPAQSASHSFDLTNPSVMSDSGASVQSTISSAMGSPSIQPSMNEWHPQQLFPGIVQQADGTFTTNPFDFDAFAMNDKVCVDPSLIQPFSPSQPQYAGARFGSASHPQMPSPALSQVLAQSPVAPVFKQSQSISPLPQPEGWQPFPQQFTVARRPSLSSIHSRHSSGSASSDESNKGLCPIPTCGRHVKDLKAHMLTHQNERPEKCPIPTCEYSVKGFARKYDKNRHTLTHYKGTMVCGFCPGSGSAAEKSFNRADVFKRHLTSVHGVEQTAPNARRKTPVAVSKRSFNAGHDVSGRCSTCSNTFANAQDFYEHLDDCVLRVVQQIEPSEAINEQLLSSLADDEQVQQTLEQNMVSLDFDTTAAIKSCDEDDAEDDEDEDEDDHTVVGRNSRVNNCKARVSSNGAICKPSGPRKGLTRSRGGVALAAPAAGNGGKRKQNYPLSWGTAPDKMKMKKRVLCVYEGQRRLWKDDMMLDAAHEVRIPLRGVGDGRAWVTDLDVQTLNRAEGVFSATEEEKGPWIQGDGELERLMQ